LSVSSELEEKCTGFTEEKHTSISDPVSVVSSTSISSLSIFILLKFGDYLALKEGNGKFLKVLSKLFKTNRKQLKIWYLH